MKCGRKDCGQEAMGGRFYCSRKCAQLDVDSDEEPDTSSESETEQSSSREPGEPFQESSSEENRTEIESGERLETLDTESDSSSTINETKRRSQPDSRSDEPSELQPSEKQRLRDALITSGKIRPSTERRGTIGMPETENDTAETRPPEGLPETLAGRSEVIVKNLEVERSATMSLIDESVDVLLDCMKTANKRAKGQELMDFRQVNSIANVGKQIAQLAKVKLDAIKEARK